jgi:hypothetical protein
VGSSADVAHVLLVLQAALGALATLGLLLLMGGNPAYLAVGFGEPALLLVLAGRVARGRRWALVTVVVIETLSLAAFQLNVLLGVLPPVDMTVNLVELVSQVALPLAIVVQCLRARA